MWSQLSLVKESRGQLGVLATCWALYRATAEEGFDMINHISYLQKLQEELHLMDNKVTDEDFVMILITSLPESWDNYTSSYLGSSGNKCYDFYLRFYFAFYFLIISILYYLISLIPGHESHC
jgi:gag-polypeptide of LTR copia-type